MLAKRIASRRRFGKLPGMGRIRATAGRSKGAGAAPETGPEAQVWPGVKAKASGPLGYVRRYWTAGERRAQKARRSGLAGLMAAMGL
jgi:hypothetical protein